MTATELLAAIDRVLWWSGLLLWLVVVSWIASVLMELVVEGLLSLSDLFGE
jgi:hypothetical protein